MKHTVVSKMLALLLFTVMLSGAVWAQGFDHKVRAEIPFSFYAGNKLLPAGTYTFGFNVENHYLAIVNNQKSDGAIVMGSPEVVAANGASIVVFRTNGEGVYALEGLKATDFAVSFQAEKTLARIAGDRGASSTTTVAALRQ